MGLRRILLAVGIFAVGGILAYGIVLRPAPATILAAPEATDWPGRPWLYNGQRVDPRVLSLSTGPGHCGWERILFLRMSTRLGEASLTSDDLLEYARDPENRWAAPDATVIRTLARFEPTVPKPADGVFSGYVYDGMELWRSEAATNSRVFLRRGDVWEQWPRTQPPVACI